jgi:hypothetical protein
MLNLEKAYTVIKDGKTYAYYGDYYDANTFYIEPDIVEIVTSKDTGNPLFKLVEYQTSDINNGAGYCTLTVELSTSPDARNAVISDLAAKGISSPNISPLQYEEGGTAAIQYPDPTHSEDQKITVPSSALANNRASFLLHLDQKQVATFKAAYQNKGSQGFPVQFFEKVDGITPAITVEIDFNATTVRTYEDKVTTQWLHDDVHDITDKVETMMPKDQNYVKVTPGSPKPPDEVIEKIKAWGQQVLNDEITQQIQKAQQLKETNQDATWTSSFYRVYQQNQVIPWKIQPVAQIKSPVTEQLGWNNFYETVDMRQFALLVTMNVNDKNVDDKDKVMSITVNVDYPTLNSPNNSTVLTPSQTQYTFTAPIAEGGNLSYNLTYIVTYADNSQLEVTRNGLKDSAYTIAAPDVGIISVKFNTSQIPFVATSQAGQVGVQGVEVDFFYKDLSGQDNPVEQKILFGFPQADGTYEYPLTYAFQSKTSKPIYNGYIYTQKFHMTDGSIDIADPITSNANIALKPISGSTPDRDNTIYLNSPVTPDIFGVYYFPPKGDNNVLAYQVKVNQVQGDGSLKFIGQANVVTSPSNTASFSTTTLNPGNQPYFVSGTMATKDGPIIISPSVTTDDYAYLYNDKRYFSVQINPELIKFKEDGLELVQIDIKNSTDGASDTTFKSFLFKEGNPVSKYWGFNYDVGKTPRYDYTITYSYTGKDPVKVTNSGQNFTILTIPANPQPATVATAARLSALSSL